MVPETTLMILYLSSLQPILASTVEESVCYNAHTGQQDPCVPMQLCTHLRYSQAIQHLEPCGTDFEDQWIEELIKACSQVCCPTILTSSYARTEQKLFRLIAAPANVSTTRTGTSPTPTTKSFITTAPVTMPGSPVALTRNHPKVPLLDMKGCGLSSGSFIVQGSRAAREQFPWMARLCYEDAPSGRHVCGCGASVISKRYLLTASHCTVNLPDNFVLASAVMGEYDENTDPDCDSPGVCSPPAQNIPVQRVTSHPCYDETRMMNDVALVRLARDIDLSSDAVTAICLPFEDLQYKNFDSVYKLFIAGWGLTENGTSSSVLRFAGLPPFSNRDCAEVYQDEAVCIAPSVMCAGGAPQDSCNGDSGGPLMMLDTVKYADGEASTRMVQAGIVSYGPSVCGLLGVPGVYTRVGFHLEWILNNMEP